MLWVTCMRNLKTGKMELIPPGGKPADEDPKYDQDVHIVPCTDQSTETELYFTLGNHDFKRNCYCHPKIREQLRGRTLVMHEDGGCDQMGNVKSDYQKVSSCVHVEFKVRVSDLKSAIRQITVNRGEGRATDSVDVLVSECIATFRALGTSVEVPVNGIQPGTARLRIATLERFSAMAKAFKAKETSVQFWEGIFKVGGWGTKDPGIVLGVIPDLSLDMPSDASFLDVLALAIILSPAGVKMQGLTGRMIKAERAKEDSIDRATRSLEPLRVEREKIAALVEDHIAEAGKRLRSSLLK